MIKYPKTIYLFPMDNQIVWDADNSSPEAEGAQEYVRADIHESTTTELQEEIGHLEDRVISQGQQLREIVNITKGLSVNKIHSTHDAVESVERLQARVAELVAVAVSVRDDLLLRSEIDNDGTRCVNLSASKWNLFCDVIDDNNSGAFILRRQAEALDKLKSELASDYPEKPYIRSILQSMGLRADSLRNKADKAEGDDNAK